MCKNRKCKAVNSTELFYEIINHLQEGISDEDIREAITRPSNASPLPGYFYITQTIEEKLQTIHSLKKSVEQERESCMVSIHRAEITPAFTPYPKVKIYV